MTEAVEWYARGARCEEGLNKGMRRAYRRDIAHYSDEANGYFIDRVCVGIVLIQLWPGEDRKSLRSGFAASPSLGFCFVRNDSQTQ